MVLIITIISILGLTGLVWLMNKILPIQICPICAGVSGTWIWILAGMYFGVLDVGSWLLVVAIAMGGSVVGIAYQVEKRLYTEPGGWRTSLLLKILFIPAGFVLVYSILVQWWVTAIFSFVFLFLVSFTFLFSQRKIGGNNKAIEELEKKMKSCC